MGAVYRAVDTRISGRLCAIKEMNVLSLPAHEQAQAVQSFQQEAQFLARLNHPNLPQIHDYFSDSSTGRHYLVMDYVEGATLEEKLQQNGRPFSEDQVRTWAVQLCDVLTYLHQQTPPIIFRDLKPDNIMLNKQGQLKLIDFGIARFFKRAQSKDTQAIGTPGYAPPEQHGKQQTDARSDIYSLGVTLWRLLTLQDPSVTPYQLPSVRRYNTAVSTDLEAIIQHAMNLRPEDRFQTMPALRQALQGTQTVTPTPPQPRQVSSVWPAIFLLLLIFVGGGVGMLIYNNQKPPPSARMATATPSSQIVVVNVVTTETAVPTSTDTEANDIGDPPAEAIDALTPTSPPPTTTSPPTNTPLPEPTATSTAQTGPQLEVLGRSANGSPIEVVRFGSGANAIIFVGGIHYGYAPASETVALRTIDYFTNNPQKIPENASVYVVKNLNPDAFYDPGKLAGRLNANGVDLNRNWDCNWAKDTEVLGKFLNGAGGSSPFSEPETSSLYDLIITTRPKAVVIWGARGKMSSPGSCGRGSAVSIPLARSYGNAAGYTVQDFETTAGEINGDATNWLDQQGIPAVTILLPGYTDADWNNNQAGILAVLQAYGQ